MSADTEATPAFAWVILAVALFAVSSAGAVFELIEEIAPVTKAAWRLQATAVVLLPGFLWQYARANGEMRQRFSGSASVLAVSGVCLAVHFGSWLIYSP